MTQHAVAIVNSKGGVGKTTTAICLAGALVDKGRRVLLVDLDPQASASVWLGVPSDGRELLALLVERDQDPAPLIHHLPMGLDLIPGGLLLTQFDPRTSQRPGRDFLLRNVLKRLPTDRWDYVFVDTPGSFGILALNALAAADAFLVPVEAATLSIEPLLTQFRAIEETRQALNPELSCAGILASRVNLAARNPLQILELLHAHFGTQVFRSFIRHNVNLAEAPAHKTYIAAYLRTSNGARDYARLADEFEGRMTAKASPPLKEVVHG
ncbi:MAG: ParA family protein [Candidatus Eisenbacteria bacterium]|nr:ParA family protein [Candidatus Eisenbacteria bacterium]